MNIKNMPQFQSDFVISWDMNNTDYPCISITRLEKDGIHVIGNTIGISREKSGVVSLRQIIEAHDFEERREKERAKDRAELLKKFKSEDLNEEVNNDA